MALSVHLFLSAFCAPQLLKPDSPIHQLPEDEFLRELKRFNGTEAAVSLSARAVSSASADGHYLPLPLPKQQTAASLPKSLALLRG